MTRDTLQRTVRDRLAYLETSRSLVIDADTHLSPPDRLPGSVRERLAASDDYFHGRPLSAEQMLVEMDNAEVDMALCWQNPLTTSYTDDPDQNGEALAAANAYVSQSAARYPERIIPAGWTDPRALGVEGAKDLVRKCVVEFGFPIVKMNPAQNGFMIDSEEVFEITKVICDLGAVPAFHFGADTPYTPVKGLAALARHFANKTIIAVHMGGGGAGFLEAEPYYRDARALGLELPNIHFILSARRDCHTESDLIAYQSRGQPFCNNLSIASDAPYGRMSWNIGGARRMLKELASSKPHNDQRLAARDDLFSAEACANFLGKNISRVVCRGYQGILDQAL